MLMGHMGWVYWAMAGKKMGVNRGEWGIMGEDVSFLDNRVG